MRVLLAEDDHLLGDALVAGLSQAGFVVDWVSDGLAAEAALNVPPAEGYAALVLDLGLPGKDGIDVLTRLRQQGRVLPVLILTARDAIESRVLGLDSGADDYVLKPFDMGELAARLRALVRRAAGSAAPTLEADGIVLDPAARTVSVDGAPVELAAKEFAVLQVLMSHAGRVLSRSQIEERLYDWSTEIGSNTVEVYIHHLRKKLGRDCIRSIRGVGYLIRKG